MIEVIFPKSAFPVLFFILLMVISLIFPLPLGDTAIPHPV